MGLLRGFGLERQKMRLKELCTLRKRLGLQARSPGTQQNTDRGCDSQVLCHAGLYGRSHYAVLLPPYTSFMLPVHVLLAEAALFRRQCKLVQWLLLMHFIGPLQDAKQLKSLLRAFGPTLSGISNSL